jgi:hypothetical protein
MDVTKETEAITLAMAAAAAAYFRPNPFAQKRPEVEAYLALRQLLGERYPAVANDILDIGPASVERQNMLKTQLQQAGAGHDPAVLRQTGQLLQLLIERVPAAATAVFATVADLQKAFATITKQLEILKHEQRDRTRHSQPSPGTATPAYL